MLRNDVVHDFWSNVPTEKWNDWKWQISHRLQSIDDFKKFLKLTHEEEDGLGENKKLRVHVTPYFAKLIDPSDPNCPIRRQVIPLKKEAEFFDSALADPLSEDSDSPVPGIVHRYPDRVGIVVTTECASYCRFCTRSRIVGNPKAGLGKQIFDAPIEYIRSHPEVKDVLLTGGDAFILNDNFLEQILQRITSIPHVEMVRISTRIPIFLPQRITDNLIGMLKKFKPIWVNVNCNHPAEITQEASLALNKLADAGIPLGSQTVLMQGINDCSNIMRQLMRDLMKNRVRPYYLYQCDPVEGAGHFRTPVAKGIEIIEALRGHTTGLGVPTFVIDMPHGGGKVPLVPNYLLSMSDTRVVLRNFEGFISAYPQPSEYKSHDSKTCIFCQKSNVNELNPGIISLLNGSRYFINKVQ